MRTSMRFFWFVALCFFLSGCSYQQFALPDNLNPVDEVREDLPVVKVRQKVQVVTHDGTKFEGEVISVSSENIVIGKPGNYGFEETEIPACDIAEIKAEKAHGAVTGVALGLVIVFALGAVLFSQIEWGSS